MRAHVLSLEKAPVYAGGVVASLWQGEDHEVESSKGKAHMKAKVNSFRPRVGLLLLGGWFALQSQVLGCASHSRATPSPGQAREQQLSELSAEDAAALEQSADQKRRPAIRDRRSGQRVVDQPRGR
jgi:hypothetical protein